MANELTTNLSRQRVSIMAWSVFACGMLYYCFAYLLRVYPNIMEPELLSHFNITADHFGLLTSMYYFAYAPMQLPVGVTVDRVGPRRSLVAACITSTLGAFLFSLSTESLPLDIQATLTSFHLALLGRFLIGLGAAFAYVTTLKLATIWLPRRYFASATGFVTGFGMVAGGITEIFFTHLVTTQGYHSAVKFPVYVGMTLFVLIFLFIKDKPKAPPLLEGEQPAEHFAMTFKELRANLLTIMKSRQMWTIGLVGCLLYLPCSVFLDVWAIPYLKAAHHLSASQAARGVSIMLTGWIFSSFVTGFLSDLFKTRKAPLLIAAVGACIVISTILLAPINSTIILYALLFLLGIFCGPHPLCFTLSKENCDHETSGTAVSFANFVIMMGGFVFQPLVGWFLDLGWDGSLVNGIRNYSNHDYLMALSILPIGLALGFFLVLSIKDTYHKAVDQNAN